MKPIRIDSKEDLSAAWGGVADAAQMPVRATKPSPAPETENGARAVPSAHGARGWLRGGLRVLRDAAIGLALIVAVPLTYVGVRGDVVLYKNDGIREKLADAERWRPLALPRNPSIDPMQAGMALRALNSAAPSEGFPMRGEALDAERIWATRGLAPDMFTQMRSPSTKGPLASVIIQMVPGGFSAAELAYLREVAASPLWAEFDKVAAANAVDMIGGRFVLPFAPDAFAPMMPSLRFADSKAMAYAGVSRAAYYYAIGDLSKAEAALRAIVSFGFALIDNGTSSLDALIGRVIADIGRDGLHQFYEATGDGNAAVRAAKIAGTLATDALRSRKPVDGDASRALLLREAQDPSTPRGMRFEALRQVSMGTCSTVRGTLFGLNASELHAFDVARSGVARFPSERAYVDLLAASMLRMPDDALRVRSLKDRFVIGAATVASEVLQNPRIASCARMVTAYD